MGLRSLKMPIQSTYMQIFLEISHLVWRTEICSIAKVCPKLHFKISNLGKFLVNLKIQQAIILH